MAKGQAERLMPLLQSMLDEHGMVWAELDAIAVGTGPGNFTGIRIAVSAARGLSLALGIPAIGVSGFEAMHSGRDIVEAEDCLVSLPGQRRGVDVVVQVFEKGLGIGQPVELALYEDTVGASAENNARLGSIPSGLPIVGARAETLDAILNEAHGFMLGYDCLSMDNLGGIAEVIGRVALSRLSNTADFPRPAPLYIRPADAAPSRDTPPVILDAPREQAQ